MPPTAQPTRSGVVCDAIFDGCLATVDVPRRALLPGLAADLRLPGVASDSCRCLIALGEQRDGTTFFTGLPLLWRAAYCELMVAIPYVRWGTVGQPYLFIHAMACDAWWAVWNGNLYYGFAKRLTSMTWNATRFTVFDEGPDPVFQATLRRPRRQGFDRLHWIKSAAALPVLGCRDDGVLIESHFDWDFRDGFVDPVEIEFRVGPDFRELPLPPGTRRRIEAYRVHRLRWGLSWPRLRGDARPKAE
jgi:hypothetical protein